jgi:hypothetical protein
MGFRRLPKTPMPALIQLPPAGSLYRLFAITGCVLCVFCLIFIKAQERRIGKHLALLEHDSKLLQMEAPRRESNDSAQRQQLLLTADIFQKILTGRSLINPQTNEDRTAAEKAKVESEYNLELEGIDQESLHSLKRYLKIGEILGLCAMLGGTALWYIKVQRYQDLIWKREALVRVNNTG